MAATFIGACPWVSAAASTVAQLGGLPQAENSIQTSSGRTFISTNGALFEIMTSSTGKAAIPVPTRYANAGTTRCYFTGLAEYAGTLYANCAENTLVPTAPKHLLALDLTMPEATLTEIAELSNQGFANGLASDGAGHLYFANTSSLGAGAIWRVTLSGRFSVAEVKAFHKLPLCSANGMKFHNNQLYVGINPPFFLGLSQILRYDVSATGLSNKAVIFQSWYVLDDFELVRDGLVTTEYLTGKVSHVSEKGKVLSTSTGFFLPTSARLVWDSASAQHQLVVTEAGANRVNWLSFDGKLRPR